MLAKVFTPETTGKIIASVRAQSEVATAERLGADMVELRLDLMGGDPRTIGKEARAATDLPLIATIRSREQGGEFAGTNNEWAHAASAVLPYVDFLDCEVQYHAFAKIAKNAGVCVIASYHTGEMPLARDLKSLTTVLRSYGSIHKVVVGVRTQQDAITLMKYTNVTKKPVITGVMGSQFRQLRAILPLFGSAAVFCHVGDPAAEGQYHVTEIKEVYRLLGMAVGESSECYGAAGTREPI
jgi:3-dehydroquinate dehydratase-1